MLDNPDASLAELMTYVQGPDFPTKGIIMGRAGIRQAYATGRGKVTVRARTEMEEFGKDRQRIIVTELPYQVNKRQLIKNIAEQVKEKRLEGISDLRDETDRNGMRIVIELKKDANAQVVLNKLFTQTALQSNFSIIMLALVDNQKQPRILSLRSILDEYIAFQQDLIVRRTRYELKKAQERAHLLKGLLIAQDNIDEVIRIIRSRYDDAKEALMERFGLDDVQAQAILDMRLKALQGLDREKLENEFKELEEKINYYLQVLGDPAMVRAILKEELQAISDKFGDDRKTEIQDVEDEIDFEDLIAEELNIFTLTSRGYIKRMASAAYTAQKRGGRGKIGIKTREEDVVDTIFTASTHDNILFFTNFGRVYKMKGYRVPESNAGSAKGMNIVNLLQISGEERVTAMIPVRQMDQGGKVFFVTRNGTVKRMDLSVVNTERKAGVRAITLDEGDQLEKVLLTTGEDKIIIATKDGAAIRFDENEVRTMGREAAGVRGIRLKDGDQVVGAAKEYPDCYLLTVTENGYGKLTLPEEYTEHHRGGGGITAHNLTDKTGALVGIRCVTLNDDLLLINDAGVVIRMGMEDIRICGRNSQGVRLIRMDEDMKVISMTCTAKDDELGVEPGTERPAEEAEEAGSAEE